MPDLPDALPPTPHREAKARQIAEAYSGGYSVAEHLFHEMQTTAIRISQETGMDPPIRATWPGDPEWDFGVALIADLLGRGVIIYAQEREHIEEPFL